MGWFSNKHYENFKRTGFGFDSEGLLRLLDSKGTPTGDLYSYSHFKSYEMLVKLQQAVNDFVLLQLLAEEKLLKTAIPEGSWEKTGTFMFTSRMYETKDTLMIIVAQNAGFWGSNFVLTEDIHSGTQLPYIKKAREKDYGLIITNTRNYVNNKSVPNIGTPVEYLQYVWKNHVTKYKASSIVFVVDYLGADFLEFAEKAPDFKKRTRGIAFLFSDHIFGRHFSIRDRFIIKNSRHWTTDKQEKPLDTPLATPDYDIPRYSIGPSTTWNFTSSNNCMESVFKFFNRRMKKYYLNHPRIEWPVSQPATTRKKRKHKEKKYDIVKSHLDLMDEDDF